MKLTISNEKYQSLVSHRKRRKKMSKKDKQLLDDALYIKYCKCLKKFEIEGKGGQGFPICMNSIYKNRRIKPPKNASRNCNKVFNKNIDV